MAEPRRRSFTLGPRTTLHALLGAYPEIALEEFGEAFARLTPGRDGRAWARRTCLADVAADAGISWKELARQAAEAVRDAGLEPPALAGACRELPRDDERLAEWRRIARELEDGGSLLDLAAEVERLTAGLDPSDAAALERAMERPGGLRLDDLAAPARRPAGPSPDGHPLAASRAEAERIRESCASFRMTLDQVGGSPSRRRWAEVQPLIARLAGRLCEVETRFRRQQQAWFPALAVHAVDGPASLLMDRQAEALELLRRLRLALRHDDAASAVENAGLVIDLLEDLLHTDEEVLEPLAERNLSPGDWAAVRELEDGVGWALIPPPPPWPE